MAGEMSFEETMKALNLTNSSMHNRRRELDYYPTPIDVTTTQSKCTQLHVDNCL